MLLLRHKKTSVLFVLNQPHRLWKDTRHSGRANISTHIYSNRFTVNGIHYYYRYLIVSHLIETSSVSSNYFKVARQMARRLTGIQVVEAEQPPSSCSKNADADRRHKKPPGKTASLVTQCSYFSDAGVIKATGGGKKTATRGVTHSDFFFFLHRGWGVSTVWRCGTSS